MMKHDQRMVDTDDWYLAMRAPRKAKSHWLDRHWLAIDAGLFVLVLFMLMLSVMGFVK